MFYSVQTEPQDATECEDFPARSIKVNVNDIPMEIVVRHCDEMVEWDDDANS